jgi:DNA recombination protein RmuC
MSSDLLIILAVIVACFGVLIWYLRSLSEKKATSEDDLEGMVNKIFGMSAARVAEQSKQILEGEREAISINLENKQRAIEKLVGQLQTDLKERQDEIRGLERDRSQKYSQISTAMEHHRKLTEKLETSTQQLAKVLSNNQTRGAWGERIIEDLMQSNGLVEGVHYSRQTQLGSSASKPDITLLLPNKRVVAVDVKFPYSEIQKMAMAETKSGRDDHLKQFAQDLKTKIKKVATYIDPEQDTLDYAIMFVPNEMVFSFINQKFPDLIDDAIRQHVIIVSPFTFLIVARTVIESYRNFMMEDRLKDVVKYVDSFIKEWSMFKDEFEKFGRSIDTLKGGYDKITTTRTVQMDRRVQKITEYQQGSLLADGEK